MCQNKKSLLGSKREATTKWKILQQNHKKHPLSQQCHTCTHNIAPGRCRTGCAVYSSVDVTFLCLVRLHRLVSFGVAHRTSFMMAAMAITSVLNIFDHILIVDICSGVSHTSKSRVFSRSHSTQYGFTTAPRWSKRNCTALYSTSTSGRISWVRTQLIKSLVTISGSRRPKTIKRELAI